jgi:hypothetical protein
MFGSGIGKIFPFRARRLKNPGSEHRRQHMNFKNATLQPFDSAQGHRSGLSVRETLYHYIFHNSLSVQHANDPVAVTCIVLGVGNHYNGCTLFIKICQQLHYFITIA